MRPSPSIYLIVDDIEFCLGCTRLGSGWLPYKDQADSTSKHHHLHQDVVTLRSLRPSLTRHPTRRRRYPTVPDPSRIKPMLSIFPGYLKGHCSKIDCEKRFVTLQVSMVAHVCFAVRIHQCCLKDSLTGRKVSLYLYTYQHVESICYVMSLTTFASPGG